MDYVLGSVAALITGNVTPNRPKLMKRALTPTKHQPSPNVTPKSEFVEDRSVFLSPSMQKKKAIVKKSPKRIFQNPELENSENGDGNSSLTSPKADKVKKHLKDDLEADSVLNQSTVSQKSPKNKGNKKESTSTQESAINQNENESTPKKKKKKQNSESENASTQPTPDVSTENITAAVKSPKKKKQRRKSVVDTDDIAEADISDKTNEPSPKKSPKKQDQVTEKANEAAESSNTNTPKKKNKRRKKKSKAPAAAETETKESEETDKENIEKENQVATKKKNKNKKRKKSKRPQNKPEIMEVDEKPEESDNESDEETTETKNTVNPNAITDKESDSEHESDNEIESENEEINKQVLESEKPEESSDEEEEPKKVEKKEKKEVQKEGEEKETFTEDEIKRTLFVGNVPFTPKVKKELKKIFSKHGQIETIRIRTVPIKDGRYTPKLALIKNELHPERTTVNVYIKYADESSVEQALTENNTVLNENHLRVTRSNSTGAEHDPKCAVFVGNLPFAMEDEALRAKFEKCGEIHSVRIVRDKKTNAGKGFGYVNFETKDGVELALALTEEDLTVKNRILRVKRCTPTTPKKKQFKNNSDQKHSGFKGGNHQPNQQRGGFQRDNNQGNQNRGNFRPDNDGNQQRGNSRPDNQSNQERGNFRPGNQGFQQRNGPPSRNNQGNRQRNALGGGTQNSQRGGFNKFGGQKNLPQKDEQGREGAHRRVMNKRKSQDNAGGDAPPNKKQKDTNEPNKEKKSRKEFVGMTAEKKKKRKFDKGQKKKKALSEILTK